MSAAVAYEETGGESLANEQLAAFLNDEETRKTVQAAIAQRWPNGTVHDGGLAAALGTLSQDPAPPILVVDVSGSDENGSGIRSLIALCNPSTRIVAIGAVNDIGYYRQIVGLGVSDYLVKPVDGDALVAAIDGADRPRPVLQPVEGERKRNVVGVIGARGGVGASTIAANIAWIAAHELAVNTAIIDLDLQFGTIGMQLDLEPSHGLREVLENPDRIDSLFVASAMQNESENLFVLSAEEPLSERVRIEASACELLLDALPDELDTVVLDLPVRSVVADPALLSQATRLVLVSDFSLAGMRDVGRLAKICADNAPDASLHTVINRAGVSRKGEIPKAEFARGTELPIRHVIAFDPQVAAQSASSGRPFPRISTRSAAVKALRELARDVAANGTVQKKSGLIDRLGKFTGRAAR